MIGIVAIVVFALAMGVLRYVLGRMEREGHFDPQSPSSATTPGLRRFFDYSRDGFRRDGIRQPPPER